MGYGGTFDDNSPPATEFVSMRWHFGTNGAIGHMGWSHNYPYSEINFNGSGELFRDLDNFRPSLSRMTPVK